jgi:ABC-2 type transport system ATP-binding protein
MMLSITNFKKQYPGSKEPVLTIDRLELNKGIYWMKGENGSGKTSLIKSMAGLIPFEGKVLVNGLDISKNKMEYTKAVNYAEAEPLYPSFLNGAALIDFYKQTKGSQFPDELHQQLGVHKFMHVKTGAYSSGMLKKLSLVLGFIGNPSLVLLDEPLIALDTAAVDVLQLQISNAAARGVSFLITSHQQLNMQLLQNSTTLLLKDNTLLTEQP